MTAVLAILGALVGGSLGAIVGFLVIDALGHVSGAPTNDGGIEMGAAMVGAPIGLVAGAIGGWLLVVRSRKGKDSRFGWQGWVSLGVVGSVLLGLYMWLLYEPPAPTLSKPLPQLITEIRVPWSEIEEDEYKGRSPYLWTYDNRVLSPKTSTLPVREGDEAVWRSTHDIEFDYEARMLYLWINREKVLMFDLGLAGDPTAQPEFSDWMPPTHVRNDTYGEDLPGTHAARIRFRVER